MTDVERVRGLDITQIKRPEFGNPEHIRAIKVAGGLTTFKELPPCLDCDGTGECPCCEAECRGCDGTKKDRKAFDIWKSANPGVHVWGVMK